MIYALCINWFEYWFAHNNNLIFNCVCMFMAMSMFYVIEFEVVGVLFSHYIFLSSSSSSSRFSNGP